MRSNRMVGSMTTHRSFRLTRAGADLQADTGKVSMGFPIMQQVVVLFLGAAMLDGGQCFQIVGCAALAYWSGFGLIIVRRHDRLTRGDKILIRWGYLMLVVVSSAITGFIWNLRGY